MNFLLKNSDYKIVRNFIFLLSLAMMSMSGLVATDIFIPALSVMMDDISMTSLQAQSVISIFLLGIALMQLIYGPVSDCFGRKPLLLWGVGLFTVVSFLLAFSTSYPQMVVFRFIQAIGACVGLTLGRAIVADLYDKETAGKIFLIIFPFVGMSPAIAPVIGSVLSSSFGWRSCFIFTGLFSGFLFLLLLLFLVESKPKEKRSPFRLSSLVRTYGHVLTTPAFLPYTLVVCFAYAAYFAYISESPFLLDHQGLTPKTIGYSYISLSLLYVAGNLCARRMIVHLGLDRTLLVGHCFFLIGGGFFFFALAIFPQIFALSVFGISLVAFGNGHLLPLGTAGGITANSALSGAASGLLGCLQLAATAAAAQLIGIFSGHDPFKIGGFIFLICLSGFVLYTGWFFYKSKARLSMQES